MPETEYEPLTDNQQKILAEFLEDLGKLQTSFSNIGREDDSGFELGFQMGQVTAANELGNLIRYHQDKARLVKD